MVTLEGGTTLKKRTDNAALKGPWACWGLAARVHSPASEVLETVGDGEALIDGEGKAVALGVEIGVAETETEGDGEEATSGETSGGVYNGVGDGAPPKN